MALASYCDDSAGRRTLQLDTIAFGISKIHRRPLPVRAEARFFLAAVIAVGGEMLAERRRIERLDAQAEVIQVGAAPGLLAGSRTRLPGWNDIDQRAAGTQLRQR